MLASIVRDHTATPSCCHDSAVAETRRDNLIYTQLVASSFRFFSSFLSLSAVSLLISVISIASPPASAAGSSSEMASDLRFLEPPLDFLPPFFAAGFFGSGLSRSGIVAPAALASFSRADALRLSSASVEASLSARLRAAAASRDAASAATWASASAAAACVDD